MVTETATPRARYPRLCAAALLGALLIAACDTRLGESFSDMFEIRAAILELSRAEDVSLHVHDADLLTVDLANSPLNDADSAARHELAGAVARRAFAMYRERDSLERVYVVYVYYERKYVLLTHTRTVEVFEFDAAELRAQARGNGSLAGIAG